MATTEHTIDKQRMTNSTSGLRAIEDAVGTANAIFDAARALSSSVLGNIIAMRNALPGSLFDNLGPTDGLDWAMWELGDALSEIKRLVDEALRDARTIPQAAE